MNKELINKYWNLIGQDLKIIVNNIEKKPETTKNRYGCYLSILTDLINNKININIALELLIKANGNKAGIISALNILK